MEEVSNATGRKVESCSTIKNGNGRLTQGEDEVQKIWKEHFKGLYNIDTQKQVAGHMCGFHVIWRGNYIEGKVNGRVEIEVRAGKLKHGKDAGKDEITGEMIKVEVTR